MWTTSYLIQTSEERDVGALDHVADGLAVVHDGLDELDGGVVRVGQEAQPERVHVRVEREVDRADRGDGHAVAARGSGQVPGVEHDSHHAEGREALDVVWKHVLPVGLVLEPSSPYSGSQASKATSTQGNKHSGVHR